VKQALFYKDCIITLLDPGVPKTDMNPMGPYAVGDVATGLIKVIAALDKGDSGAFSSWTGEKIEW
jgi:hypothetical protein